MIKLVAAIRRVPTASHEGIVAHWENIHAANVSKALQPLRYTVTFFDSALDGSAAPFDGIANLYLKDAAHVQRATDPVTVRQMNEDGFINLVDTTASLTLVTEEHVIVPTTTAPGAKLVAFARRRTGVGWAQFQSSWLDVHAPSVRKAVATTPGFLGYTVSLANAPDTSPYDGMAELWWANDSSLRSGLSLVPEDDFARMCDPSATLLLVGRELVVV